MENEETKQRKEDLVSIIVLSYKNLGYYTECLESILMQTYENIEIIFCDDGTPDFNGEEIERYILCHKNENIVHYVIHHNSSNVGIVKNLNRGIKRSKGNIIIPLALDDALYEKDTVEKIVQFFREHSYLILTGYREIYDPTMQYPMKRYPKKNVVQMLKKAKPEQLFKRLCSGNIIAGASTPFTKKFIEQYDFFDEDYRLIEDYPRYLSISRNGCKMGFMDEVLIKYRMGGISGSKKDIPPSLIEDSKTVVQKEILPYRKQIGFFLYRLSQFELKRRMMQGDGSKWKKAFLYLAYGDMILYKLIWRWIYR